MQEQGSFEGWTYFTRSNKKKIHMHISTVAGTIVYLSHPLKHLRHTHTQKTITTMKHARKRCLTCPEGLWYLSVHIQITIQHDTFKRVWNKSVSKRKKRRQALPCLKCIQVLAKVHDHQKKPSTNTSLWTDNLMKWQRETRRRMADYTKAHSLLSMHKVASQWQDLRSRKERRQESGRWVCLL